MRPTPTPVGYSPQGRPGLPGPAGPQGPQGIPGPAGARGPAGADAVGSAGVSDYGSIRFDEMAGLDPTALAPGVLTPFVVTQPTIVRSNLRGPFKNHQFLDAGNVLRARADFDAYTIRTRLQVMTNQAGGRFQIGAIVQGNVSGISGFVASRKTELSEAAGVWETVDLDFLLFPQVGFISNGGILMMRCSVSAMVSSETIFIIPQVAG